MSSINRRSVLIAAAGLLLLRDGRAADAETALFWTVTPQGRKGAVLFGYDRIAAALVPDIVKDGDALVASCQRVVIDMPQDVSFPTVGLARNEIKPILPAISPQTADRLRKFIAGTPAVAFGERLGGLEAVTLLQAEGQHDPNGTSAARSSIMPAAPANRSTSCCRKTMFAPRGILPTWPH